MSSEHFNQEGDMLDPLRPRLAGKVERIPGQTGRIARTWRELDGHPCPYCTCSRYTLVFRFEARGQNGMLSAKCSQCERQREIHEHEVEQDIQKSNPH
ncbi:MAG: hypothetical protein HZB35_03630 [Nitrospirae bacterium]|nr:hypothetical protein [Nitrospirota bacterium]